MFLKLVFYIITGVVLTYLFYPLIDNEKPLLIINMWNDAELPKNFRMSSDVLRKKNSHFPNLTGLKELRTSGSAQFSEKSLDVLLKKIPSRQIIIIDLREESHGFINGIAVSWFVERNWMNKGKSLPEILENEKQYILQVSKHPIAVLYANRKIPIPLPIMSSNVEAELASSHGFGYLRIPVTDHMRPTDQNVEQFINFVKSLPEEDTWLHFHCAAGEGRTTTFLVMYDMMLNAAKVKLQDIFLRQHLLGGIDFLKDSDNDDWRNDFALERKAFLYQFYTYCQQNPFFRKSWSQWIDERALLYF